MGSFALSDISRVGPNGLIFWFGGQVVAILLVTNYHCYLLLRSEEKGLPTYIQSLASTWRDSWLPQNPQIGLKASSRTSCTAITALPPRHQFFGHAAPGTRQKMAAEKRDTVPA